MVWIFWIQYSVIKDRKMWWIKWLNIYLMIQKHMHNCSFQFRQKNQESAILQTAPNVLKKKQLHFQIFY